MFRSLVSAGAIGPAKSEASNDSPRQYWQWGVRWRRSTLTTRVWIQSPRISVCRSSADLVLLSSKASPLSTLAPGIGYTWVHCGRHQRICKADNGNSELNNLNYTTQMFVNNTRRDTGSAGTETVILYDHLAEYFAVSRQIMPWKSRRYISSLFMCSLSLSSSTSASTVPPKAHDIYIYICCLGDFMAE